MNDIDEQAVTQLLSNRKPYVKYWPADQGIDENGEEWMKNPNPDWTAIYLLSRKGKD